MKSKILVWLCLGLVFGAFLHFTCHIGTEKKDVSNTVKDRIVYMNVDELRVKARNGDKSAYKYLKEYFHRKGHSEEIFYFISEDCFVPIVSFWLLAPISQMIHNFRYAFDRGNCFGVP